MRNEDSHGSRGVGVMKKDFWHKNWLSSSWWKVVELAATPRNTGVNSIVISK
jgi:hypothetical protein